MHGCCAPDECEVAKRGPVVGYQVSASLQAENRELRASLQASQQQLATATASLQQVNPCIGCVQSG